MSNSEFTATNFMEMKVLTLIFSWSTHFVFAHPTKCQMVLRKQSSSSSKVVFNLGRLKVKRYKRMLKMLSKNLEQSGRNSLMNACEFSTLTYRKTFSSSLLKNTSRKNDMWRQAISSFISTSWTSLILRSSVVGLLKKVRLFFSEKYLINGGNFCQRLLRNYQRKKM